MVIDGTLEYGARMPTEEQLAYLFVVSRITAKRAMDELANEGLVELRRGKGTHVIYRYSPKPVQAPLTGMLQEIESMARNSHAVVLDYGMRVPPQSIRTELSLADGEAALHFYLQDSVPAVSRVPQCLCAERRRTNVPWGNASGNGALCACRCSYLAKLQSIPLD